jgi:glycosyltransferase involved in cell wall biosynthesis
MASISVVIPAYRAEPFLAQTLESVLSQTIADLECIVVDDGSDDGTRDIMADYARRDSRVCAIHQPNSGPSVARNRGFAARDGSAQFVSFLDADDVWEPDALELLTGALRADPSAAGAHGVARFIGAGGELVEPGQAERRTRNRLALLDGRIVKCAPGAPTTFGVLILRDILLTPGNLVVRAELVERIGGFDPQFHGNEDWDFALRLTAVAHLAFLDRPVLRYRKHAAAMSQGPGARETFERERVAIMRKLAEAPDLAEEQRRVVRRADGRVDAAESRFAGAEARASLRERRWGRAAQHARQAISARARSLTRPFLSRIGLMTRRRAL